jgi:2,3-bisphosphoglycerate-independent phosphoglycerate mutase
VKYAIVIPEGAADDPIAELEGCTPLVAAHTPHLDSLSQTGRLGTAILTPAGRECTDDVTLMSLLGYAPRRHLLGCAPIEAAGRNLTLQPGQWALRLSMVTVDDDRMIDHTAGGIGGAETAALLQDLAGAVHEQLGEAVRGMRLVPARGHRAFLIDDAGRSFADLVTHAPPLLLDKPIRKHLPGGKPGDLLRDIIETSAACFQQHPVNQARTEAELEPATHVWPWGAGCGIDSKNGLPAFADRYEGLRGVMVCSRDVPAGLARLIGWDVRRVDDDAGYVKKGKLATEALDAYDVVCVHTCSPDVAAHKRDVEGKIDALAAIDKHIIAPLADRLRSCKQWRILVAPTHYTHTLSRRHHVAPAPFLMAGERVETLLHEPYTEANADASDLHIEIGDELMEYFLFGSGIRRPRKKRHDEQ